jgi:four helix bundle protein
MTEITITKRYDLESRTLQFAKDVRVFINQLPKTIVTIEDGKQVVRSSGSIGANYIEANEALSKKDFKMRIMICRKESKETCYWLELLVIDSGNLESQRVKLLQEATELRKIFGAILEKSK